MTQHKTNDLDNPLVEKYAQAEDFFQKNKKVLSIVIGGLVLVVAGWIGYKQFVVKPNEAEAQLKLFKVQEYYALDSFNLVLNGRDENPGAVEIADDYGMTKAGKLAAYYAGMSYLYTGQYENAIEYLKKFSGDDMVIAPMAKGSIGDAYAELGNLDEAADHYMKAANMEKNELTTPVYLKKAALVYYNQDKHEKALECYELIKKDYKTTPEGAEIDKYIARCQAKTGKIAF